MSGEGEMKNSEGLKLYTKQWLPSGAPKAVIFIIHGAAEHCDRYHEMAERFNSKGFAVFSMDHQGHGKSEGTRQHVKKYSDYTNDYLQYMKQTLESNPSEFDLAKLPRFLWGHSMGGKIGAQILIRAEDDQTELSAACLTGPALMNDPGTDNAINRFLARTLSMLVPTFAVPWEKGPVGKYLVCGDPAREAEYRQNPLVYHGCLRVGWAWQFIQGVDFCQAEAERCKMPVLCMHGSEDKIVPPLGTERWVGKISSKDKKISIYEGAVHELHNDKEDVRNKMFAEMSEWFESHMTSPKPVSAFV